MLDINSFDESVLGSNHPDPLRFAFGQKHSAHAGGMATMVPTSQHRELTRSLYDQSADTDAKRCLYIHIPFCRVRCTFCNFFQNAASRQMVDDYFDALVKEIEYKASLPWTQSGRFHAVYVGGGTPTDLSATQIEQLGKLIQSRFPLSTDCEITLEGRINRFGDEMFERALEGGFNRFSFGVQSFNTQVRRSAKRLDGRDAVLERVTSLSASQAAPIIIDLLYGLPYQTLEVFEQDLKDFLSTGAHGIDLYQLVVAGSAPMLNLVDKGKLPTPASTAQKAEMYQLGDDFMRSHHLRRLSVNHWALDNRERSQYNSLAKTYAQVLPIGCGAGGNIAGYSMMNHRTLKAYMEAMKSEQSVVAMLSKQHALEPVFAALKSGFDQGVLVQRLLPSVFGLNVFDYLEPLFAVWQAKGLVEREPHSLRLTLAGRFWAVSLAQACIQVLQFHYQQQSALDVVAV
ncbi:heme anaerobic degradation radical SAM methyltransferase ChuW/HutW [Vibrio sp. JPW-9-11-11]|uniref:heme anaerobic degradation radical SAM methyltransferase ChuW/HutW n=1 Tax=Vibrio sp. JPW-9-11-11 TaxID=1416532 RepID=UPI001593D20E|nr:heme anaerobic degradation radical SAM methyltransferase ChuW/HutW [Vibrio sp. JPW-9-11-11]NVD08881.1 heme anaerobic degradation radical SAM methyltransferase ChuW/HutW [Vibrio sp. JPW-9-11-11]